MKKNPIILFILTIILISGCREEETENAQNKDLTGNINMTNTTQQTNQTNTTTPDLNTTNENEIDYDYTDIECYMDEECDGKSNTTKRCQGEELWQDKITVKCFKPATIDSFCEEETGSILLETCAYGCYNRTCNSS